jgi:hypothetical protein
MGPGLGRLKDVIGHAFAQKTDYDLALAAFFGRSRAFCAANETNTSYNRYGIN